MLRLKPVLIWSVLAALAIVPVVFAVTSPLLQWRGPIYIIGGVAGVLGMVLLLVQPLLAAGLLPHLPLARTRLLHRWSGAFLTLAVILHVGALWITSPPDVIDALLFASPTPFAVWGVIAMWAVFAAALMAALRKRMRLRPTLWRFGHTLLVSIVTIGTVIHAVLIQGTMESVSKAVLAAAILAALGLVVLRLRVWKGLRRR